MRQRIAALLATLLLAASAGSGAPTAQAAENLSTGSSAIVVGTAGEGLRVRSGPGPNYPNTGLLADGTTVTVTGEPQVSGGVTWYPIRARDGSETKSGWVAGQYLVVAGSGVVAASDGGRRSFTATVVGYSSTGGVGTRTATGTRVRWGTVAVDPAVVPLGSLMTIEGLEGVFIAEDTGGAVRGTLIDVWFPDVEAARAWGMRKRTVTIMREGY